MAQKIALIEDDEILSKFLFEELKAAGFDIQLFGDGEAGLAGVRNIKPDLVLLDLVIPKKTGMEVLQELKADTMTQAIPVIVITMNSDDETLKKALGLGANDYFIKSQHPIAEIVEKIKQFFFGLLHF